MVHALRHFASAVFIACWTTTCAASKLPLNPPGDFDYIIVGGGTAGLVVASRLTEDPQIRVAVIEAGEDGRSNPNITDFRNHAKPYGTQIDWAPLTVPQRFANGRQYQQIQG